MPGFLYRKNGGQVLGATTDDPAAVWQDVGPQYGYIATKVAGVDMAPGLFCNGAAVRNATQAEKDNWADASQQDSVAEGKAADKIRVDSEILLRAVVAVFTDEVNLLRSRSQLSARTVGGMAQAIRDKIDQI